MGLRNSQRLFFGPNKVAPVACEHERMCDPFGAKRVALNASQCRLKSRPPALHACSLEVATLAGRQSARLVWPQTGRIFVLAEINFLRPPLLEVSLAKKRAVTALPRAGGQWGATHLGPSESR